MTDKELESLIERKAKEWLSQFCISPGTPHWIAGERDYKAGFRQGMEIGRAYENAICMKERFYEWNHREARRILDGEKEGERLHNIYTSSQETLSKLLGDKE